MAEQNCPIFSINVRDWRRSEYARRRFPYVSKPREVAFYSKDGDNQVMYGSRKMLRRYRCPPIYADLNHGYETFIPKRIDETGIHTVVNAVKAQQPTALDNCEIITFRNNLNCIGRTPIFLHEAWDFNACLFGSKLLLEDRIFEIWAADQKHMLAIYNGHHFETLCSDEPDEPVNANFEFCSVSEFQLAQHRILVSAETDCTLSDPEEVEDPIRNYVELKTMKMVYTGRDLTTLYRYRFPKFWMQAFIAGVQTIIVGCRSANGHLVDLRHYDTQSLPLEAERYFRKKHWWFWRPATLLNFLDYMLIQIHQACSRNPGLTVRVKYDPDSFCVQALLEDKLNSSLAVRSAECLRE